MYNEDQVTKVQHEEEEKRINYIRMLLLAVYADLLQGILDFKDLAIFAESCLLSNTYQHGEVIYAILPIPSLHGDYYSLIIGRHGINFISQPPSKVINELCRQYNRISNYQDLSTIFKEKMKVTSASYVPYVNTDFVLMPIHYCRQAEMAWINPNFIDEFIPLDKNKQQAGIRLAFDLTIPSTVKDFSSLKKYMKRAFLMLALVRREHLQPEPGNSQSLDHYLKLRTTKPINSAVYRLFGRNIQGEKGDLTEAARGFMFRRMIKDNLTDKEVMKIIKLPLPNKRVLQGKVHYKVTPSSPK